MADVWLDALSMLVVAPTMLALAMVAWQQMPEGALQSKQLHAWSIAPSLAANKFAVVAATCLPKSWRAVSSLPNLPDRRRWLAPLLACCLALLDYHLPS
jgi:hypothetical protein